MLMGLSALSSPKEEIMKMGLNLEMVITLSEDNSSNATHKQFTVCFSVGIALSYQSNLDLVHNSTYVIYCSLQYYSIMPMPDWVQDQEDDVL